MKTFIVVASAMLVGLSATMAAHHSGAGDYSKQQWKTITGTVKEWRFTNPHPVVWVNVKNEKGVVETWSIQFHAPSKMGRQFGWHRATFKPGDELTVNGHPYYKVLAMFPVYVTMPDGKKLGVAGDVAPNDY